MTKIILVLLLMISSVGHAVINTSWNTISDNMHGNLKFNVNVGTAESPDYYPLQVKLDVQRITADGHGKDQITTIKNVGTNQATPFDFSTVQGLKDIYTALPAFIRPAFKEAILAAIDEDASI